MNFIKKIFEKKEVDDVVHKKFVRYGKGEYDRLYFTIKKSKTNFRVKSSFDFANSFVNIIANNIKENAEVSGKIIAFRDFEKELGFEPLKFTKRGKLYTAEINQEMTPEQLKSLYEKFESDFLLLNIKSENYKLTTKGKLPKPGGKIKENFCSATLPMEVLDEFAFDFEKEFNEAKIKHKIIINEIITPEEYKNDPVKARIYAKRKGELVRILEVDGRQEEKRTELVV